MLTCQFCMQRCLRAIIGEPYIPYPSLKSSALVSRSSPAFRRTYTLLSSRQTSRNSELPHPGAVYSNYQKALAKGDRNDDGRTGSFPTSKDRDSWLKSRGIRPVHKKPNLKKDYEIAKEAQYLKDPLKLADFVRKTLRKDEFENAEALVRAASKDVQCTVSWNHLIDWQLSKGRMNAAIKTYNEMKKRTQIPDAHTYTIIFRGCAEHPEADKALEKVLSIYQSLLTEKSSIKPNTIHMNAVLKMCAKAVNMEALFTIAEQMPAKGIRAPNNLTYTIMLNAIQKSAVTDMGDLTPMQRRQNIQKAILDGRRMWDDIVKRWRQGDVMIDEELVCAMGRLLLLGDNMDRDDIFSLIEQSMSIPRQLPKMARTTQQVTQLQGSTPESPALLEDGKEMPTAETQVEALTTDQSSDLPTTDQLQRPGYFPITTRSPGAYAKPGRNSLSLILTALLPLHLKDPSVRYWTIFTQDIGVHPDRDNYAAYLRILRILRASAEATSVLQNVPKSELSSGLFRIAMSACERDKLSSHAFTHAGRILDVMQTALPVPFIPVLQSYLEIAVSSTPSLQGISFGDPKERSKRAQGRQILRALERLNPSFLNLKSLLTYGDPTKPNMGEWEKKAFADQVMGLIQRMIGAYDLLTGIPLVERSEFKELIREKSKLAAFVTRAKHAKQIARKTREGDGTILPGSQPASEDDGRIAAEEVPYSSRTRGEESSRATMYHDEAPEQPEHVPHRFRIHRT